MTAESLLKIAEHGGPRCCKRDTFLALLQAVDMIQRQFHISLSKTSNIQCQFHSLNAQCIGERCPFYMDEATILMIGAEPKQPAALDR